MKIEKVDAGYVVARPAIDAVVGLQVDGVDEVVAPLAEDLVPAQAHLQPVGAIPTVHVVVAGVAEEPVGAAPAEDGVGPAAGDGVLAFSADEAVPSAVTINIVRQSATPPVVDNASIAATATSITALRPTRLASFASGLGDALTFFDEGRVAADAERMPPPLGLVLDFPRQAGVPSIGLRDRGNVEGPATSGR